MTLNLVTTCGLCGNSVEICQDDDHSEYVPSGTCKKCGAVYVMLPNGQTTLISTHHLSKIDEVIEADFI